MDHADDDASTIISTSKSTTNDSNSNSNSNGIEVFLRIRPSKNPSGYLQQDDINESQLVFNIPKASSEFQSQADVVNNSKTQHAFQFNGILDGEVTQDEVFSSIGVPAVNSALAGFNSTIFAYGQTGSGKTFTITGGPERYVDRGIIPRAISMLFANFQGSSNQRQSEHDASFTCFISYLELYNESGYDLLASSNTEVSKLEDMPKVTMLEDEDGNYHFRNLSVNQVHSEEDALNLLFLGDTNRAIGETEMNQSSSRSHCIFTVMIEKRLPGSDTVIRSKLNLVDLAGSERVHKTNSTGQTLKEAQYINTSLFFLEMVIVALHEKSKKGKDNTHIPYRNSMMTSVLRDSLGGNARTVMVATISPEEGQTNESISTCHFAQRVALVKNCAYINEELEPKLVIRRLKAEVKRLREEIKFIKGENGEGEGLTAEQEEELKCSVKAYLASNGPGELNIGKISLTKIQATYAAFKHIWREQACEDRPSNIKDDPHSHSISTHLNGENGGDIGHEKSMRETVLSLQKTLQQRDEEIKVLVGMVKKSGAGDLNQLQQFDHRSSGRGQQLPSKELNISPTNNKQLQTKKVRGVEKCVDQSVLHSPSKAFNFFRERYPGEKTLKENKKLLQLRFQEAKSIGQAVKESRQKINEQKSRIEKIRRQAAMSNIANDTEIIDVHPDEVKSLAIIEEEKQSYKQGFEKLRELKGAIEHIKQLMEKNQRKLQVDFECWYADSYESTRENSQIDIKSNSNYSSESAPFVPAPQANPHSTVTMTSIPVINPSLRDPNTRTSIQTSLDIQKKGSQETEQTTSSFALPDGVRLTGNKEADEDIIAFYKAKEALLARTRRRDAVTF